MALGYRESGNKLGWRQRLHEILYEADTKAGARFDILLFVLIIASIVAVMLESVASVSSEYGGTLYILEWLFTIFFTLEYIGRIISVKRPLKYIFSFFGIIDLLSILPSYLGIFIPNNTANFRILRILRLMRIFRVLKLVGFVKEGRFLKDSLIASRSKILVFLFAVLLVVVVMGTLMYIIESDNTQGFDSIPRSIYWAIVTLTTVGYGDISPSTPLGQFVASIIMLLGYAIIAVPTGIVSSEMAVQTQKQKTFNSETDKIKPTQMNTQICSNCQFQSHDDDADFCKKCGESLHVRRD